VNGLVSLYVQAQMTEFAAANEAIQAEMKKLGDNGPARIKAAESYLKSVLTKEEYEGARLFFGDAVAFAGLEKLIEKATAGGPPANANGGGNPPRRPETRMADRFYPSTQKAN
jgi:hypothetical protein